MADQPQVIARVVHTADGGPTPHDGRYVVAWNPHTQAGVLELNSTDDPTKARVFDDAQQVLLERETISEVQPQRPWDRLPNRPLRAISVLLLPLHQNI